MSDLSQIPYSYIEARLEDLQFTIDEEKQKRRIGAAVIDCLERERIELKLALDLQKKADSEQLDREALQELEATLPKGEG